MTTFTITVKRPKDVKIVHNAIRAIPFGITQDAAAIPRDKEMVVVIRAKRKNDAYNAATSFIDNFDGKVIMAQEMTGNKVVEFNQITN